MTLHADTFFPIYSEALDWCLAESLSSEFEVISLDISVEESTRK